MGAEAKRYLLEHSIPQLFEGLMTGLICNKPEDPIVFLESAIGRLRANPDLALKWDSFVEFCPTPTTIASDAPKAAANTTTFNGTTEMNEKEKKEAEKKILTENKKITTVKKAKPRIGRQSTEKNFQTVGSKTPAEKRKFSLSPQRRVSSLQNGYDTHQQNNKKINYSSRSSSSVDVINAACISDEALIILFMGGPGGGKTRYAAQIAEEMADKGLIHVCMPDLIKQAILKYKDINPEWKEAAERYQKGKLIPNNLAQNLIKAEMGKHPQAKAYFLEGFPREARQVEDFERNVRQVNMAMIIDYDEKTLREHMHARGLLPEVIDRRIQEFKQKTLPSAKYFDDQGLLHLIPGEKDKNIIVDRMRKLINRVLDAGTAMKNINPSVIGNDLLASPKEENEHSANKIVANDNYSSSLVTVGVGGDDKSYPNEVLDDKVSNAILSPLNPIALSPAAASTAETIKKSLPAVKYNTAATPTKINGRRSSAISLSGATTSSSAEKPPISLGARSLLNTANSAKSNFGERTKNRPGSVDSARSATLIRLKNNTKNGIKNFVCESRTGAEVLEKDMQMERNAVSLPLMDNMLEEKSFKDKEKSPESVVQLDKNSTKIGLRKTSNTVQPEINESIKAENELANKTSVNRPNTAEFDSYEQFPKRLPAEAFVILIIGAPGSNKSYLAREIAKKYKRFVHISMGELFRRKIQENLKDELWIRIGKKIDAGEIIPMKICRELLYSTIQQIGINCCGYVIEGYPRTLPQVEDIEAQLERLDIAILIDSTEQYCKDTLKRRYEKNIDEGGEQTADEPAVVKVRLEFFKQNTLPMLKYLDDKGKLHVVRVDEAIHNSSNEYQAESHANVEKIFQEISDVIDNIFFNGVFEANENNLEKQSSANSLKQNPNNENDNNSVNENSI